MQTIVLPVFVRWAFDITGRELDEHEPAPPRSSLAVSYGELAHPSGTPRRNLRYEGTAAFDVASQRVEVALRVGPEPGDRFGGTWIGPYATGSVTWDGSAPADEVAEMVVRHVREGFARAES